MSSAAAGAKRQIPRWLFDIVTLVLAILAIIFAIIQFGDARGQIKQAQQTLNELKAVSGSLGQVAKSVQTRYVGSFPDNMDDILKVIEHTPDGGQLSIMTDFSGYGLYSRNDLYLQYISKLRQARNQRAVNERILVYGRVLTKEALRKQFSIEGYNKEKSDGFRRFFVNHPPTPRGYADFLQALSDRLEEPIREMCSDGIQVRLVPPSKKYIFFMWANSRPQALFAFRNESESYRELSFTTLDTNLTSVFQILFNQTWDEVDPKKLDRQIEENNQLMTEIPARCIAVAGS